MMPSGARCLFPVLCGMSLVVTAGFKLGLGNEGDVAAYATRVPPPADPIAESWQRALAHPARPQRQAKSGTKEGLPPWERRNTVASTSLFEKFPHNPVLALGKRGSLDAGHAEYPSVAAAGDIYWLFYSAYGAHYRWEIAAAVSPDGIAWTKLGAVLVPAAAAWDSATVAFPSVIYDAAAAPEERFRMWYAGKRDVLYEGIGYATSANGREWRRHGCVLRVGAGGEWDGAQIVDPCVIAVDGGYRMYYCGSRDADSLFAVGMALSADGRSWVKYPDNPIYILTAAGGRTGLYTVDVVVHEDQYILFASAPTAEDEYEVHAVLSPDGFSFAPAGRQVVLAPSRDATWDDAMVYGVDVLERGGHFYMWFNGIYDRNVTQGGEVGLARAPTREVMRLLNGREPQDGQELRSGQ